MSRATTPVPAGCHTITPHLVARDAIKAIDFYQRAFGAQEVSRMLCPMTGKLMHGELKIGDSLIFLADDFPEMGGECTAASPARLGGSTVTLNLYVPDVDAAFQKAVAAGAVPKMPPSDMFWGDRYSQVTDPFGHIWAIATHIEDVSPEECRRRGEAFFAQMAAGK